MANAAQLQRGLPPAAVAGVLAAPHPACHSPTRPAILAAPMDYARHPHLCEGYLIRKRPDWETLNFPSNLSA